MLKFFGMFCLILFLSFGIFYFLNFTRNWVYSFVSITSQMLAIFCLSTVLFGCTSIHKLAKKETENILSRVEINEHKIFTEKDISKLPEPVKNWLKNSGMIGKPFLYLGKITQKAEMKMKPEQDYWMNASAIQYTVMDNPAFIWEVNTKMNNFISFQGRDKFENGKGEMLIKLNSFLTIVDEKGEKLDEGSLQRYLGEVVWFPSLAVSPYIVWEQIDKNTAKATMTYKGVSGSGIFYFTPDGNFAKFSAFRFKGNELDSKRYEWVLLVQDYKIFEGIKVPSKMTATWKLENQDWTWLNLEIIDIKYNNRAKLSQ